MSKQVTLEDQIKNKEDHPEEGEVEEEEVEVEEEVEAGEEGEAEAEKEGDAQKEGDEEKEHEKEGEGEEEIKGEQKIQLQGETGQEAEEVEEEEVEIEVEEEPKEKKSKRAPPKDGLVSLKRRKSLYEGFDEKQELFRPEFRFDENDKTKEKMWELMDTYLPRDKINIQKSIVKHIEYTLATTRFDVNSHYLFQGTALSVRDRLLEQWNDTQLFIRINNPKKIYPFRKASSKCFSLY